MPPRKPRTPITLHQSSSPVSVGVDRGAHADVAGALLHDEGEDDPVLDAFGGTGADGVPDAADVFACVAGLGHLVLVEVEDLLEGLPLVFGGEVVRGAGELLESHFDGWKGCK